MPQIKHHPSQLPGELSYRHYLNENEVNYQLDYYKYQQYRMQVGLLMQDIDVLISDQQWESFLTMRNMEYSKINNVCVNYAILEMKHFRVKNEKMLEILESSTPSLELANKAELPFFLVKYFPPNENKGNWEFSVYPVNKIAKSLLKTQKHMSDRDYINFLYKTLRKQEVPSHILNKSSTIKNNNNFEYL
jgi:hypothetical protein